MIKSINIDLVKVGALLSKARRIAVQYYNLTRRPLGITGEIAEYEAARLLNLKVAPARQAGYDAVRLRGGKKERIQVKGRCVMNGDSGQRIGSIKKKNMDWEFVMLVLLDNRFEPTAIYEAPRKKVVEALEKPGSKARNERGALSVSQFIAMATLKWPLETMRSGKPLKERPRVKRASF